MGVRKLVKNRESVGSPWGPHADSWSPQDSRTPIELEFVWNEQDIFES